MFVIRNITGKYFLPACGLSFDVFELQEVFDFDKDQLMNLFLYRLYFGITFKSSFHVEKFSEILSYFFQEVL